MVIEAVGVELLKWPVQVRREMTQCWVCPNKRKHPAIESTGSILYRSSTFHVPILEFTTRASFYCPCYLIESTVGLCRTALRPLYLTAMFIPLNGLMEGLYYCHRQSKSISIITILCQTTPRPCLLLSPASSQSRVAFDGQTSDEPNILWCTKTPEKLVSVYIVFLLTF